MKLGFIGFGKSTNRYHMPFIDESGSFDVVSYYTRGTRTFEMLYPLKKELVAYTNLDEFLNSDIEVIVISTPAKTHFELAKKSILANKHVIVEKPFCESVSQARELYDLAKKHNVYITPYQNRRYDSDFLTIKNILDNYDLGRVMEIESNHTHYRVDGADSYGDIYDGSVYGHAVHFIDQIVSIFGEPDDVIADICNQKNYYIGKGYKYLENDAIDDYYDIKLIYGNMRIRVRFSQLIVKEPPRWIINATNATVEKYMIDQQERDLKNGIYLDNINFGIDSEYGVTKIYKKSGEICEVETTYKHYTEFYRDAKNYFLTGENPPVKEQEAYIVLNILETIVNNRKYKKL